MKKQNGCSSKRRGTNGGYGGAKGGGYGGAKGGGKKK